MANDNFSPVFCPESEAALIGCLLLDPSTIEKLEDFDPNHFHQGMCRKIYNLIGSLLEAGQASNREGLATELVRQMPEDNKQDKEKLIKYLDSCFNASVTAFNPLGVAKRITDLYIKRTIIDLCKRTISDAISEKYTAKAISLVESLESELFNIAMHGRSEKNLLGFMDLIENSLKIIEHNYQNKGTLLGVTTGLEDIDSKLNGFQNTDLIIIAGRPSMGKTALALNMAYNAAVSDSGKSVLFFSLEMSAVQLTNRIISSGTKIDAYRVKSGNIRQHEYDNIISWYQKGMYKTNIAVDDSAGLNMPIIRSRARKFARKNNLGIIFIDYLQLIQSAGINKNDNRVNELSKITRELKQLAKELNVPIVVLSQLSRAVESREDKRPLLSDLRESGSIEQDADVVMFIYREEYYARRSQPKLGTPEHAKWQELMESVLNQAEVIIAKHRNGPTATVPLHYDANTTTFSNLSRDPQ